MTNGNEPDDAPPGSGGRGVPAAERPFWKNLMLFLGVAGGLAGLLTFTAQGRTLVNDIQEWTMSDREVREREVGAHRTAGEDVDRKLQPLKARVPQRGLLFAPERSEDNFKLVIDGELTSRQAADLKKIRGWENLQSGIVDFARKHGGHFSYIDNSNTAEIVLETDRAVQARITGMGVEKKCTASKPRTEINFPAQGGEDLTLLEFDLSKIDAGPTRVDPDTGESYPYFERHTFSVEPGDSEVMAFTATSDEDCRWHISANVSSAGEDTKQDVPSDGGEMYTPAEGGEVLASWQWDYVSSPDQVSESERGFVECRVENRQDTVVKSLCSTLF